MRSLDAAMSQFGAGRRWVLRRRIPLAFPFTLNVEPTDRCDCRCVMCPRLSGQTREMEWALFEKAIGEVRRQGGVERLYLHKFGEPLLHPEIDRMIRFAKETGATQRVVLTTNGRGLSPELSARLLGSGLDELKISVDAASEGTYLAVKGVPGLSGVEENVRAFVRERDRRGLKRPTVVVKMLLLRSTQSEAAAFRERWRRAADRVLLEGLIHYGERWRSMDPFPQREVERYPCAFLWYTLVLNADGSISICCADHDKTGVVGHLDEGIHAAWRGPALRAVRERHLDGRYDSEPCRSCSYWRSREDIGTWLRGARERVL